jgi:hypothetical protein
MITDHGVDKTIRHDDSMASLAVLSSFFEQPMCEAFELFVTLFLKSLHKVKHF